MPIVSTTAVLKDRKKQLVTELRSEEILEAAARVFGARGFESARVDDIAAEAGLAKMTVYAYFESKDAIYEAVVERALKELMGLIEERIQTKKSFAERMEEYIAVRLMYWEQKQVLYRVIWSVNSNAQNRKRAYAWMKSSVDYLVKMFEQAYKNGEIPKQNFEVVAWALFDQLRGVYDRRIHGEDKFTLEEDRRNLTEFTLRGLGCKMGKQ
jgi:AcrR family transcriptional regulator